MMITNFRLFYTVCGFITLSLISGGCRPKFLPPDKLEEFIANPANGLLQVHRIRQLEVVVAYLPVDILVARNVQMSKINFNDLDSLKKKYNNNAYFLISMSEDNREILRPDKGFNQYSNLINVIGYQFDKFITLTSSKGDTLLPSNYYLDRTFAKSTATQVLISFPKPDPYADLKLHVSEFGLNTGDITFSFDNNAIQSTPELVLN